MLGPRPSVTPGDLLEMQSLGLRPRNLCLASFMGDTVTPFRLKQSSRGHGKEGSWGESCLPKQEKLFSCWQAWHEDRKHFKSLCVEERGNLIVRADF